MPSCDRRDELIAPRLPVRASIYIAPDGTVHFGALFGELVPVAAALSAPTHPTADSQTPTSPLAANRAATR